MSKFRCKCGNIIRDQTDDLPYKAVFLVDQDWEASFGKMIQALVKFIRDRDEGKEHELFDAKLYAKGSEVEGFITDTVTRFLTPSEHLLYECEVCGRLWVQPDTHQNWYVPYSPETGTRGVLRGQTPGSSLFVKGADDVRNCL